MTRLVPIATFPFLTVRNPVAGVFGRLRRHIAGIDAAMTGQTLLASISAETESDTGLSAEELTGVASHDPALPFFMQAGFGRRDR